MRYIKYILLKTWIIILFVPSLVHAHSSIMATYAIVEDSNNEWTLTVSVPLIGLHEALLSHYDEDQLIDENGQYNGSLAAAYIQDRSLIKANIDQNITLRNVSTKLSNHQSDFIYSFVDPPVNISRLDFDVKAMSENSGHINIVRIKREKEHKKLVLQAKNHYQSSVFFKTLLGH